MKDFNLMFTQSKTTAHLPEKQEETQSKTGALGWIMLVQLPGEHSLKPADLVKPELGCQH